MADWITDVKTIAAILTAVIMALGAVASHFDKQEQQALSVQQIENIAEAYNRICK